MFVVPFPNTSDAATRLSSGGGFDPVWAHSGRELFYRTPNRELVAAEVASGDGFSVGDQTILFTVDEAWPWTRIGLYDVSLGDDRFVMVGARADALANELIVVENVFEELNRLLPN